MPISSPNSAAKIRLSRPLLPYRNSPPILHQNLLPKLQFHPFPRLRCGQTLNYATAQNCKVEFEPMDLEKYARELEVAVKAVHMASLLCRRVQESLVFERNVNVQSKDDDSPVTVAGMILPPFRLKWDVLKFSWNSEKSDLFLFIFLLILYQYF